MKNNFIYFKLNIKEFGLKRERKSVFVIFFW